jgi:hypothetical protein
MSLVELVFDTFGAALPGLQHHSCAASNTLLYLLLQLNCIAVISKRRSPRGKRLFHYDRSWQCRQVFRYAVHLTVNPVHGLGGPITVRRVQCNKRRHESLRKR